MYEGVVIYTDKPERVKRALGLHEDEPGIIST